MNRYVKGLLIITGICVLFAGCASTSQDSENVKILENKEVVLQDSINISNTKAEKFTSDDALNIINGFIEEGKIRLMDPSCEVQYFFKNDKNFHVIRIAYVDPKNKEYTETTARFWVSADTGEIFEEELFTGKLTKVQNPDEGSNEVLDSEYVGAWHSSPYVSAAFAERYVFASDGTYKFFFSQYDEKKTAYSQEGKWEVQKGELILSISSQINVDKTVSELSDVVVYPIGDIEEESPENSPYKYKTTIGGNVFWKYSDEANFWDNEYNEFIGGGASGQ